MNEKCLVTFSLPQQLSDFK